MELQQVKGNWHDIVTRISQYQRDGLLTPDHVSLIRNGQKENRKAPVVAPAIGKLDTASQKLAAKSPELVPGETVCSAPDQVQSQDSSLAQVLRNLSSQSCEMSENSIASDDGSESSLSDPTYQPWTGSNRWEQGAGVLQHGKRSRSEGVSLLSRPEVPTSLQQALDRVPPGSAFPSLCPLCFTPFSQRRGMIQHLCGNGHRPASCPVRKELFPVDEDSGQVPAAGQTSAVSDSNRCSATTNLPAQTVSVVFLPESIQTSGSLMFRLLS